MSRSLGRSGVLLPSLLLAISCADEAASPDGGVDAGVPAVAEAEIGAAGGSLTFGPVILEVPAGAVSAPTTFRIREAGRTARLPGGATAASTLYRLEPAASFAAPVRVKVAVDRARVPAGGEGLLLLRAPTGTDEFQPIGAAEASATEVEGETTEFSEILIAVLRQASCVLPDAAECTATCDRRVGSCTGACTLSTGGDEFVAECVAEPLADRVSCTCRSSEPGRLPTVSGALQLSAVLGGSRALTAWTFLTRCGWPCGDAPTDAGVDGGPLDAVPPLVDATADAGPAPRDAAFLDATPPVDAGEPVVPTIEVVSASAGLRGAQRLRVGDGWVSWARPTLPDLRAMNVSGMAEFEVAGAAEFPAEHFGRAGAVLVFGAMGITEDAFRHVRLPGPTATPIPLEAPELAEPELHTFVMDRQFLATDGRSVWLPGYVQNVQTQAIEYGVYQAPIAGGRLRGVMKGVTANLIVAENGVTLALGNTRTAAGEVDQCGLFVAGGGDAVQAVPRLRDPECDLSSDRATVAPTAIFWKDNRSGGYRIVFSAIGGGGGRDVHVHMGQNSGYGEIVAGRTHVYWLGAEGMMRIAADGSGMAERVFWMPPVVYLAYDDGYLYWLTTRGADTVLERARVD